MQEKPGENSVLVLLGSANRHKLEEVGSALAGVSRRGGPAIRVIGPTALPPAVGVEETGATFLENARIKARAYAERAAALSPASRPRWVLADDSGLCVAALDGAPGVRSARYAAPAATDADNNQKLLEALRGVPESARGAEFVCCLSLWEVAGESQDPLDAAPGELLWAEGRSPGLILGAARGRGGFGYDPLFLVPAIGKTFAELSEEEKNAVSHRGRALRALCEQLEGPVPSRESGRIY